MKKFWPYIVALGAVTLWGIFSHAYLGVEDGSSGLTPLGWLCAVFILPGHLVFRMFNDSYSNSDMPAISVISWVLLTPLALLYAHVTVIVSKRRKRESNKHLEK